MHNYDLVYTAHKHTHTHSVFHLINCVCARAIALPLRGFTRDARARERIFAVTRSEVRARVNAYARTYRGGVLASRFPCTIYTASPGAARDAQLYIQTQRHQRKMQLWCAAAVCGICFVKTAIYA